MFRFTIRDVLWLYILSLLLFGLAGVRIAFADDASAKALPQAIERVLNWLPEDTETLIAVQSFELPQPPPPKDVVDLGPSDLKPFIDALALAMDELDDDKYLKPLLGQKVKLALCGSRHFEIVSAFGTLRSESCAIIVFEKDLGEVGTKWIDLVRQGAKETREIAGHKVFVFPSTLEGDGGYQAKPWQGTFLVLLKPDTLLCASSDRYLAEVLQRVEATPQGRALADDLPEWKLLDPRAPAWMLRHIPDSNRGRKVTGLAWTWKNDRLEVIYLPDAQSTGKKAEQAITARWTEKVPDLPARPGVIPWTAAKPDRVTLRPDGTVAVSIPTKDLDFGRAFWFGMHLYALQGENGSLGAR